MKALLALVAITLSVATSASAATRINYTCGKLSDVHVSVIKEGKFVTIFQSFPADKGNGILNIYSEKTNPSEETGDEAGFKPFVTFKGFHYPNGDMYIAAENDTNEEGYNFYAPPAMLEGAKHVKVSDVIWSEFRNGDKASSYSCTRD
ncbi:MAG: hypothetical protein ACXWQO_02935 [Bdellovibrionota bacterium]